MIANTKMLREFLVALVTPESSSPINVRRISERIYATMASGTAEVVRSSGHCTSSEAGQSDTRTICHNSLVRTADRLSVRSRSPSRTSRVSRVTLDDRMHLSVQYQSSIKAASNNSKVPPWGKPQCR